MRYALMVEPQQGITWPEQVRIAQRAEAAGFDTLYRSDHFQSFPGPAGGPTSDGWTVIGGLVREASHLRHGTLVSPVTFRPPGLIAKIVATANEMSDGRVELGLGAGWHVDEHRRHGFPFPDLPTRLEMLEEQIRIVGGLWSGVPGWSFDGRHYQVEDALFAPAPAAAARPPLIIGTRGAPAAIRLAARYSDHLNLYYCTPEMAARAFGRLDDECRMLGRDPREVTRSVLLGTVVGEGRGEADRRRAAIVRTFEYEGTPEAWQEENGPVWVTGTPTEATVTLTAFEQAGADLVVFQDFLYQDLDLIDQLGALAAGSL